MSRGEWLGLQTAGGTLLYVNASPRFQVGVISNPRYGTSTAEYDPAKQERWMRTR